MKDILRKWWFWVLAVVALAVVVAVIWGPAAIGVILSVGSAILFSPGYFLVLVPFEYFGIVDEWTNLDVWVDYLTLFLLLVVSFVFWVALGDTIDILRGADDEEPDGRFARIMYRLKVWRIPIRRYREKKRAG